VYRTAIRDVTLRARRLLVNEIRRRPGGSEPVAPAIRRIALVHLVRLVTFRMLEARGLARGKIDSYPDSDDFREISAAMNADHPAGRLRLGAGVLRELIEMLNERALQEAWGPGREEAIGWIHQYFNEPDLEVFHSQSPPKVPPEMLAAKTQLFTPRWIVEFLVANTLGRLWVQMHPDSRLVDRLAYLVPLVGEQPPVRLRPVREISVLDPACGTMHFGLVVFDLLLEMYKEELSRAGGPGWPEDPSVHCEEAIPAAILANNLFGFDIDPLAVRLSGLTLWLKARTAGAQGAVADSNLHCADVLRLNLSGRPAADRKDDGGTLKAMAKVYDVVVTNPPYLDSRDYEAQLKSFMAAAYPASKRNLYAAFLERCVAFLSDSGRLGIVTPQTFMFISSFAKLRTILRDRVAIETLVHTGLNTFPDATVDAAFYVLRRTPDAGRRDRSVGTYFRLLREPDAGAKRAGFENALRRLTRHGESQGVYHCRQREFDAIPGRPWVYWVTAKLRELFRTLPTLAEMARPVVGLQTSDNFRFLRYWWEVFVHDEGAAGAEAERNHHIALGCRDRDQARLSGKKWFPHMKGGSFRRWYGNQDHVVNWAHDGAEIRNLGIESGKVASRPQNVDFYFRPGVTWTHTSSRGLSVRVLPPGFICNVEGMAAFQRGPAGSSYETLAILNSAFARHVIDLLNPTVHFGGREVGGLPYPLADESAIKTLEALVGQAVALARADCQEDETSHEFVAPPAWRTGAEDVARRHAQLAGIEQRIDEEVYRLYGLGEDDRAAIEADLSVSPAREADEDRETHGGRLSRESLAHRWISYAVGVVMGRFRPGAECGLGRGRFTTEVAEALRAISIPSGIAVLDPDHDDDLARRVQQALELILGGTGASEVIRAALGDAGKPLLLLRCHLERGFFKQHLRQYRKRPIYWLLQSPRRLCSVYVHYERMTPGTLPLIGGSCYLGGKLDDTRRRLDELRVRAAAASGREKIRLEREVNDLQVLLTDLEAFDCSLRRALEACSERGETVGWIPEMDDGVMLNLAPLHELVPSWSAEPLRHWKRLEAGDCDWSFTARRYWPDRVLARCRRNKSIAIAHGQLDVYEGGKP